MIVVSDTTLFSNFIQIDRLDLLPAIFGSTYIPQKVYEEVLMLDTTQIDLTGFTQANWISVRNSSLTQLVEQLLVDLDAGESEAIAHAQELKADYLLTDDSEARKIAQTLGLRVTGSIGILIRAKASGLILEVKDLLDQLIVKAGFWVNKNLYKSILESLGE